METDLIIVNRSLPQNIKSSHIQYFENELSRNWRKHSILNLTNVWISQKGDIQYSRPKINPLSYILIKVKSAWAIHGPVLLVHDRWSHGYFHWWADLMPKVFIASQDIPEPEILLPHSYRNELYEQALKIFGIHRKVYFRTKYFFVRKAILISPTAPTGNFNELIIRGIRDRIYKWYRNLKPSNQVFNRVYISREKADKRRVRNENEIKKILRKYGFEIIYTETLSLPGHYQLFSNTQYLISLHGAGLTNMIFMKEDTRVLEIKRKYDFQNLCYFSLANALKIDYYYLLAEGIYDDSLLENDQDVQVDLVHFEDTLLEFLS